MDCKVCQQLLKAELEDKDLNYIVSTAHDIEEFESNRVWSDIRNTLISWLITRRDALEEMGEGHSRDEITYVQAESHMVRCLLNLPAALKSKLEEVRNESGNSDGQEPAE